MYRNKSTENEKTIFWFGIELVNGNDVEKKLKLLGIVAMTMIRNNELQAVPTGTNFVTQEVLGLGIVFKATAIKELVDSMPL